MTEEAFFQTVGAVLPRKKGNINRNTRLNQDLKADKLSFLQLILALEYRYGFYFHDEALALAVTVGDLYDLAMECIGKRNDTNDSKGTEI
ncbi:MAG: acyl carrier protein [Bacillota bacterium]|nr:acyl carrier protein [Bacillota bacterium]